MLAFEAIEDTERPVIVENPRGQVVGDANTKARRTPLRSLFRRLQNRRWG